MYTLNTEGVTPIHPRLQVYRCNTFGVQGVRDKKMYQEENIKLVFMEKFINIHTNNYQIKNDKYRLLPKGLFKSDAFYKPLIKAQKSSAQQQGEARAKYHLQEINRKFVNLLMRNGEKSKALSLFIESLNLLEKKSILFKDHKNHYTDKDTEDNQKRFILCQNKDTLFTFYTNYDSAEKDGSFDKNKKVIHLSIDNKNKNENKNKGLVLGEEYYYNSYLKNNILYRAIENVKPPLELRRVRKGGTTYQVPAIVSQKRQERLAIKWIIEWACKRKNKKNNSFSESLVIEILEAFNKTGQPRQKRDEILKIAEFNRAYTRYRWW